MKPKRRRAPATFPSVDSFLRRTAMKRWLAAVAAVLIAIVLVIADRQGWLLHKTAERTRYDGRTFRVVKVIDGDTLDIDIPDDPYPHTRIRFWGVDTPETAKPREGTMSEPFADEAWEFTRRLCEGKPVTVRLEGHQVRDRYGRLLAYVELPDGACVNELLLLDGLARFEPRFPHRHMERYELLERQAKFEKKGMWKK